MLLLTTEGNNEMEERSVQGDPRHKDNSFKQFRRLCAQIADVPSYNAKTDLVQKYFRKGSEGEAFKGDLYVWIRLLLPGVIKRVYNVQSKQLVKIFSRVFGSSEEKMLEHLEQGDVAETVTAFFEKSKKVKEAQKSKLTVHDVDSFLARLSGLTREDDQQVI